MRFVSGHAFRRAVSRATNAPSGAGGGGWSFTTGSQVFNHRVAKRRAYLFDGLVLAVGPGAIGEQSYRKLAVRVDPQGCAGVTEMSEGTGREVFSGLRGKRGRVPAERSGSHGKRPEVPRRSLPVALDKKEVVHNVPPDLVLDGKWMLQEMGGNRHNDDCVKGRIDLDGAPNRKTPKTNSSGLAVLGEKQPGNEKTADHEKQVHAAPAGANEYRVPTRLLDKDAVTSQHHQDRQTSQYVKLQIAARQVHGSRQFSQGSL